VEFGIEVARALAMPLHWAAYQGQVSLEGVSCSIIPVRLAERIKEEWIHAGGNSDVNPVTRVRLAMQQFGNQLHIVPLHHNDDDGGGGVGYGDADGGGGQGQGGGAGGGGGGGAVFDSEAYFSQLFIMQQRTE
jgi:hypothetical protein